MNKKLITLSALTTLLVLPVVILAAPPGEINVPLPVLIEGLVATILNILWSVCIVVIIIMFVIAGFKFLTAQGDPGKVAEARQSVIWGLAGATVVVLAWSIIAVVRLQLGV